MIDSKVIIFFNYIKAQQDKVGFTKLVKVNKTKLINTKIVSLMKCNVFF